MNEALFESALQRLDPVDENTRSYSDKKYISVGQALTALGAELRSIISHAFAGQSLEEVVAAHRTDITGLQARQITHIARTKHGFHSDPVSLSSSFFVMRCRRLISRHDSR